ncbi:MAG TPA: ribosome silencing factor [Sediminispirochaeta sp.]|nr:ribosome silencing factor [Sediminispirochaeta sp.]
MVDTVKTEEIAVEVGRILDEHKCRDTVVIDVREQSSWTDYFVIATVNSMGHLRGLVRQLKRDLSEKQIGILHRHKRVAEDGWELIDCGFMLIHLMDEPTRDFYDLEKLWFNGKVMFQSSTPSKSS